MCSISASDAQVINLKRNGKENETQTLLLHKSISNSSKPGVFVRFLLHSRFYEMSGSILFFYFAEEAMKDRELSNEKLPQCAVALQFFGKLIQI